jgi:YfiH family protein
LTPIALYEFDSLKAHGALLRAGCTGRGGGVSEAAYQTLNLGLHVGDDPQAVRENRRRVAQALGTHPASFAIGHQVHGAGVRVVRQADRGRGALTPADAFPDTDALITRERGIVLAVLVADCVPVILFDPITPAVGVVHAGWKGTVAHVARNAVEAMSREFASDPHTLLAGVGPSIGPASYEVSTDVAALAQGEFPGESIVRARGSEHDAHNESGNENDEQNEKHLLDLWGANTADLVNAGVPRERIEVAELDTFELHGQFFSHRRQAPTGRFMALAMLRE